MTNLEIKIRLEQILAKIQENNTNGYNDDGYTSTSFECICLEDCHDGEYVYNGWLSELEALHDDIIV
jgi:hypothetical protein